MPTDIKLLDGQKLQAYNAGNAASATIQMNSSSLDINAGGDVIIGGVGSSSNLVFEESASISGQGTNTITLGVTGDTINLNTANATYNFSRLTGSPLITGSLTVGGDVIINKTGYYSTLTFAAQANDPGFIRHYENNNVSYMQFSVSDDNNDTDYFSFGCTPSTIWTEKARITASGKGTFAELYEGTPGGTITRVALSGHTHTVANITWPGASNLATSATGNNQEWSIDLTPGSYTGTYWQVWSYKLAGGSGATCLKVEADNGKVTASYDFAVTANATIGGTLAVTGATTLAGATATSLSVGGQAVVVTNDSRLSDSRTPTTHAVNASTYGYGDTTNAGHLRVGDGISVTTGTISVTTGTGLEMTGTSPNKQVDVKYGTAAGTACQGNDSRLSDARTPNAHGDDKHNCYAYARISFAVGQSQAVWTHNKNWANYITQITPSTPEAHFYYKDRTSNSITICLDDPAYAAIDLDITLTNASSITTSGFTIS